VTSAPLIETSRLGKRFGAAWALRDLSLDIQPGEVFGYLGPNGAGKTTTIRLLLGLLRPTEGRSLVCGHDAWRESVAVRRQVGYVPGEPAAYGRLTGRQHIEYFSHLRSQRWFRRADDLAERLDLDLDRPSRDLSRGNRQKLALVLALMPPVDLLVLDEPTSGLDPLAQQEFHALVREHATAGGGVLLSSHVLSEVQRVADRVGVLRAGELIAVDRLDDLRSRSLHHIHATFSDPVQATDFARLPRVRDLVVADHALTCSAPEDALDEIVKALSRHTVRDLTCTEAELEETFLAYYGTEAHDAA
jgi:ABC-2 type transport system ATP-binding protein